MTYKEFLKTRTKDELEKYAESVGTSVKTLMNQYFYAYRYPRPKRFDDLVKHTNGLVSDFELREHFRSNWKPA